jgi:hypothetical protein
MTKNMYILVTFLYTNNDLTEEKYQEIKSHSQHTHTHKYLGVNLTKVVKDLFNENFKIFMKKIEESVKAFLVFGYEELKIFK